MKLSEQDQDLMCSAGFVALGAAQVIFRKVYKSLKENIEEEALKRADYKRIKKENPAAAAALRDEMARQYFTPDQRERYKQMMRHIDLLMKDFEWTDSFAMLDHLQVKLKPGESADIFDALQCNSNELARLIFLWADYQDNNPEDANDIMLESFLKLKTRKELCGHLAHHFIMH